MSGPWERYGAAAPAPDAAAVPAATDAAPDAAAPAAAPAGPWAKYASAAPAPAATAAPAPTVAPAVGTLEGVGAGLVRGVRDVIDKPAQMLANVFSSKEGERVAGLNDTGKADFDKAYGGSTAAEVGRVGGQVAATLPVGGLLGAGAKAAAVAGAAPKVLGPLASALASGGMKAEGAGLATRAAGGAITGGVSAGLVDPEQAGTGAAVGAALPAVVRGLGTVANKVGQSLAGPEVASGIREAAEAGANAGYVVPPTQVKPSLLNRAIEGMAGKISTAQNASARNQEVTNTLARQALGVGEGEALSGGLLGQIRKRAGDAYEAVRGAGDIVPDEHYLKALSNIAKSGQGASKSFPGLAKDEVGAMVDSLNVPVINSSSAIDAIGTLREAADKAYRAGDKAVGRAHKDAAAALEAMLERGLPKIGAPAEMVDGFRKARQTIAKTYTLERAMNPTTGNVDARKLAADLRKGKALSPELRQAAEFATAFPKATQAVETMGSLPQTSPLDWSAAAGLGAMTGSPLSLAGVLARPAARMAALSPTVQRGLTKAPAEGGSALSPRLGLDAAQILARVAPVALAGRGQ